jgi:hypothetical protein
MKQQAKNSWVKETFIGIAIQLGLHSHPPALSVLRVYVLKFFCPVTFLRTQPSLTSDVRNQWSYKFAIQHGVCSDVTVPCHFFVQWRVAHFIAGNSQESHHERVRSSGHRTCLKLNGVGRRVGLGLFRVSDSTEIAIKVMHIIRQTELNRKNSNGDQILHEGSFVLRTVPENPGRMATISHP